MQEELTQPNEMLEKSLAFALNTETVSEATVFLLANKVGTFLHSILSRNAASIRL